MELKEVLYSKEDKSVNFIFNSANSLIEARFVRRVPEYFIVYLSSHNGCNKACRFCHLTQTKQTSFVEQSLNDYLLQVQTVLNYYDSIVSEQGMAKKVNFNFMSRGEPLANSAILNNAKELFTKIEELAKKRNLIAQFNISTIMPDTLEDVDLNQVFGNVEQNFNIYYSLYSVDESFRKRWLPKALNYNVALQKLESLQKLKNNPVSFHWAFIKGENDSINDIERIKEILSRYKIKGKFNLVRYNPYSDLQGVEPEEEILERNFKELNNFFNHPESRIVPRVGFDVKASCGMFINNN